MKLSKLVLALVGTTMISGVAFAQSTQAGSTLAKVKETGVLTIGHRESSIPFSYYDDKQQPVGYMMDLCNKVADKVKAELKMPNLQVKLQPVNSSNRIPLMKNGTIDLECGSTTNSKKRQEEVAFGPTTFIANVKTLVKVNSGINDVMDLKGKTIVTTQGTTSGKYIKEQDAKLGLGSKEIFAKDHAESFLMVDTGRADAFEMDDVLLYGLIANAKNPKDFKVLPRVYSSEPYGIMIRKDDPDFKKLVTDTVAGLMKSGEAEKIYTKWFLTAIPPKGINMNLPMSNELKEAFKNPNDVGI